MSELANHAGWWSTINRRVQEREIRRQTLSSNIRKAVVRRIDLAHYVADHVPSILREFLKMITGSLLCFWVIGKLLAYLFHARPLYTFAVLGLLYSIQASYYKYRLSSEPEYKIPSCRCAGKRNDHTEVILKSRQSAILKVPNSVLGGMFYITLLVMAYLKHSDIVILAAVGGIAASTYLAYVMMVKIGSLCVNCVNVSALNVLILFKVATLAWL